MKLNTITRQHRIDNGKGPHQRSLQLSSLQVEERDTENSKLGGLCEWW